MQRILIADDHAIVREGLKQILAGVPHIVVAGEASDGRQVLERVRTDAYDIVLLDIAMPGMNGLEVLKQLKEQQPNLRVLMLSVYPEEQYAVRSLRSGASGYLTKASAPQELVAAVRKVAEGGNYVSAVLAERLALYLNVDKNRPLHARLSDREYEVVVLIASGRTVSQIAGELALSVKTVSTHRSRALAKMRMKTNAEITLYGVTNGLLDGLCRTVRDLSGPQVEDLIDARRK